MIALGCVDASSRQSFIIEQPGLVPNIRHIISLLNRLRAEYFMPISAHYKAKNENKYEPLLCEIAYIFCFKYIGIFHA